MVINDPRLAKVIAALTKARTAASRGRRARRVARRRRQSLRWNSPAQLFSLPTKSVVPTSAPAKRFASDFANQCSMNTKHR